MRAEIISIHAPTRGATSYVSEKIYTYFISIHAPTRGATGAEGHILQWFIRISIHAPTRGATNHSFQNFLTVRFQSTLPQGERRSRKRKQKRSTKNFNPRSHKGSDILEIQVRRIQRISIHAPTRGATINTSKPRPDLVISIHAPTRGATPFSRQHQLRQRWISIHAPTRGATSLCILSSNIFCNFNPRSHKGSDGFLTGVTTIVDDFNPRSHKGSDSNFTQNSISVLFHFYQSFPHIIFPHTARFRLLIIFCTFFLVRIAQGFPVCFHFAPKQYLAFYNVCSTDLL